MTRINNIRYVCLSFLLFISTLSFTLCSNDIWVSPDVPSVSWRPIQPTVQGFFMDEEHPGPVERCEHTFVEITPAVAQQLVPTMDIGGGLGPQSLDDGEPAFALMYGGLGSGGEVLDDMWILKVQSLRDQSYADWWPLTHQTTEGVLPARYGYSLEWLPTSQRLVAFGGIDAAGFLADAWEYVLPSADLTNFGWQPLILNVSGIDSDPVARANNGGWIRLPTEPGVLEKLILFGGSTSDSATPSGKQALDDLYVLQVDQTHGSAWMKPENISCTQSETVCEDAKSFATLFPELAAYTSTIQAMNVGVRPEEVLATLESLAVNNANLTALLNDPYYVNWTLNNPTTDGPCEQKCIADDAGLIENRPSKREGHRVSLWDWTDPSSGERTTKLILFGGFSCPDGSPMHFDCFDPSVYFLDLTTFKWSVWKRPEQPPKTPAEVWPLRRAYHTQHVYTDPTTGTAQLWIFGGTFIDLAHTLTFKNDVAVLNLLTGVWHISSTDLSDPTRIDEFGNYYNSHPASSRMGSFLSGNSLWIHGGCHAGETDDSLEPMELDPNYYYTSLWVMKLNQYLRHDELRVVNDELIWLFGQGVTKSQPGRKNYFFVETAQNEGFNNSAWINDPESPLYIENEITLKYTIPSTNSTAIPWWGPNLYWASGLASRLQVQMVSSKVQTDGSGTGDPLLVVQANIFETLTDGVYVVEYVVSAGSQYEVYISYDGIDVPGSPFHLKLETGLVSPILTRPAGVDVPIPPIDYREDGITPVHQHYGSFSLVPEPLAGAGLGLQKGLRGKTASFLLQIVDIYQNDWIDNTNAVIYMNDSIYSGVPFDAINLTLALYEPDLDTGKKLRDLNLDNEFHYINNENGTYTVTYRVPDLSAFRLNISINGEQINHGETFLVEGVDRLELSEVQAAGMLSISVILTVLMFLALSFFALKAKTPVMRSRSLLFDSLFVLGTMFGMFAILDQTDYSGGYHTDPDDSVHSATHNPCQMYNVLIGMAIILCYGSLYGMVRRAHLIFKRVRQSAQSRDGISHPNKKVIVLNQDVPNCPKDAPLPVIPNVNPDSRIILPVLVCIVVELVFQTIWIGAAPLHPAMKVASDDFRAYRVCDGAHKETWVYVSIGLKLVMCAFFLYFISNGRKIGDPIGETKLLAWVGYNMSFTTVVAVLLVFFLDSQDSIKTSFIASTFAIFWSCLLMLALVFLPRIREIVRAKAMDQFWYDSWIINVQEEELAQRAREKKEREDAKKGGDGFSSLGGSQLSTTSGLGNSSLGGSDQPGRIQRGTSSGNLKTLKEKNAAAAATTTKPSTGVNRAMPAASRPAAVSRATSSSSIASSSVVDSSPLDTLVAAGSVTSDAALMPEGTGPSERDTL